MAKRAKEPGPDSEIVKVVDPLYDAPVDAEEAAALPAPSSSGSGFRKTARRLLEVLLRLISWVIIFSVFAAALYYGVPLLYQRFVIPIEQNTVDVADVQSKQQQLEGQLTTLQEQLSALQNDQSQDQQSLGKLDERVGQLETSIESHTASLAALEDMQTELQKHNELTSSELERQIKLVKSMELLSRARLYMYQSNFGLAKVDVQAARDLLHDLQLNANTSLGNELDAVILRLDMVLSNLPNFPVAASDDLDIAWQILMTGAPAVDAAATAIPPGTTSFTPEPTVIPTLQATPTP